MSVFIEHKATDNSATVAEKSDTAVSGGQILMSSDAHSILTSKNAKPSLSDGFEIVGTDVLKGVGTEVTQHIGRVGKDLATGAVVGLGVDLAIGGVAVVAGTAAAEAVGVVAAVGGLGYGAYKLYQAGSHLYQDAKALGDSNSSTASRLAANENATDIGGSAVDTTAALVGGGIAFKTGLGRAAATRVGKVFADMRNKENETPPETTEDITLPAGGTIAADHVPDGGEPQASQVSDSTAHVANAENWSSEKLHSVAAGTSKSTEDNNALDIAIGQRSLSPAQLEDVTNGILSNPELSQRDLSRLSTIAQSAPEDSVRAIFAATKEEDILDSMASNPNVSKGLAQEIINALPAQSEMSSLSAKQWMASMCSPAPEFAEILANDADPGVRASLIYGGDAPVGIVNSQLVDDPAASVRVAAARFPFLNDASFTKLSKDEDPDVRRSLASNTSAPPTLLQELGSDPDKTVRDAVATNAAAPRILRENLFAEGVFAPPSRWNFSDARFQAMKEAGGATYNSFNQYEADLAARRVKPVT